LKVKSKNGSGLKYDIIVYITTKIKFERTIITELKIK